MNSSCFCLNFNEICNWVQFAKGVSKVAFRFDWTRTLPSSYQPMALTFEQTCDGRARLLNRKWRNTRKKTASRQHNRKMVSCTYTHAHTNNHCHPYIFPPIPTDIHPLSLIVKHKLPVNLSMPYQNATFLIPSLGAIQVISIDTVSTRTLDWVTACWGSIWRKVMTINAIGRVLELHSPCGVY